MAGAGGTRVGGVFTAPPVRHQWRLTGATTLALIRNRGDEGDEAAVLLTRRARGYFAPKHSPRRAPSASGSAWVRRRWFRPKPAKNGLLGARLGRFSGAGAKKSFGEAVLEAWLEML